MRHRVGSEHQLALRNFFVCCVNFAQHAVADALEAPTQSAAPQVPVPAAPQPQLGLQEYQLRQLAALLGSANMAALQSMSVPPAAPHSMPDSSAR